MARVFPEVIPPVPPIPPVPIPATIVEPPFPSIGNRWTRHMIQTVVSFGLAAFAAWLGTRGIHVPVPAIDVVQVTPATTPQPENKTASIEPPPAMAFGWNDTPELITTAKASLKTVFRQTPSGADDSILPKDVYQWQTYLKVRGKPKRDKNQNPVGSCVAFGCGTASENALICTIAAGEPFEFTEFSEEVSYALMRVDIGRGELRGQDGAVGGWAARARTELGALPKGNHDGQDFSKYEPSRARRLGDTGVSPAIKAEAAKYKAGDAALLRTWLDVKKALAAGHGVFTCSRIGFRPERDSNGVAVEGWNWGHCMNIDGYHVDDNGTEYTHFDNSWNLSYHRGPVGWGNPNGAGFWCRASIVARMLSEGDSYTISAVKGFARLDLDWNVLNVVPADRFALLEQFRFALTNR